VRRSLAWGEQYTVRVSRCSDDDGSSSDNKSLFFQSYILNRTRKGGVCVHRQIKGLTPKFYYTAARKQTLIRYGESSLLPKYLTEPFFFGMTTPELCLPSNVQEHVRRMIGHAYSLQGMSTLASPYVSLICLSTCLQGTFRNACTIYLSRSFLFFFTSSLLGSEGENWHRPPLPVYPRSPCIRRSSLPHLPATPPTTKSKTFIYRD
jgi:hypothetical protein